MPGAGSASVAYATETSFLGGVGSTPTYVLPGTDVIVEELSLDNTLERVRLPDERESARSVNAFFEGALSITFNAGAGTNWHDLVFNDTDGSGNDIFSSGSLPPSAEWYIGTDFEDGGSISTAERVAEGWVCTDVTIDFTQGQIVPITLTGLYGDESLNTSLTPGSVSDPGTEADFAEFQLDLDATTQLKLSSATLTIEDIHRFQRGSQRAPVAAVGGPARTTLTAEPVVTGTANTETAYGASAATSPEDNVGSIPATVDIAPGGSSTTTLSLSEVTPATYDWQDVVDAEADITEAINFQVNGISQTA